MFGNRNLGYFEISQEAFEHIEFVKEIMSQVVVLKAELHFDDMSMHYCAIGPFKDVEPSTIAPHYNIECDDEKTLTFVKGDRMDRKDWLTRKLYNCLTCYDTQVVTCSKCNGSGEGDEAI